MKYFAYALALLIAIVAVGINSHKIGNADDLSRIPVSELRQVMLVFKNGDEQVHTVHRLDVDKFIESSKRRYNASKESALDEISIGHMCIYKNWMAYGTDEKGNPPVFGFGRFAKVWEAEEDQTLK